MRIVVLAFLMVPFVLPPQRGPVHVGGMYMEYEIANDSVTISLRAPTNGWVGIGFNDENNIVGSDLLLFHVVNGEADGKDMFVKGIGDPREDIKLSGRSSFDLLSGKEENGQTRIQFRIPMKSEDSFDFHHSISKPFWLILAYSSQDEFDHHSLMRRHIPYVFEAN